MTHFQHHSIPPFALGSNRSFNDPSSPIPPARAGTRTIAAFAAGVAAVFLVLGAGFSSTARAEDCSPVVQDLLVVAHPLAAMVRPRECATVEQNPPDFSWPHVGGGPYTVNLTFPDGHTESRTATHNWLNWNGTLPAGNYTWTVARSGLTSLPRQFTVSPGAVPFVVPDMTSVINQLLAKPHPRGLPDSATLALMASQRDAELRIVRFSVDSLLGEPLPPNGSQGDGDGYNRYGMRALWSLMAYAYDRTDVYKEDARRRVLNLAAWDARGPTAIDNQESRFVAWVVALGYDWLGPVLSPAEQNQLLSMLNTRIGDLYDWIIGTRGWPDPNAGIPPPIWQSPRDSHRNVTAGVVAAMATLLVGDLPAASTWVQDLLPFTLNVNSPWSGEEGGYANGTAYSMWDVGALQSTWYVLRWATCGGSTCIDIAQKAWVRNWGRYLAYFVPPTYAADVAVHDARKSDPGTPIGLFGDGFAQPELFDARTRFAKGYAHFSPSALGCWYASGLTAGAWNQTRMEYLMSPPDPCAAPAAFPPGTPHSLYLPSTGWLAMHSDLSDLNRASVYFKSSPPPFGAFNHQSADQNAFAINSGGERLAIESGYYDGYSTNHWQYWVKRTKSKNAITFDGGQGQVAFEHLPEPFVSMGYGSIVRRLSGADYEIATGDATQAYNGALTRAVRTLVYLRPGTLLVYDSLASSTARTWEWNLHALSPFTVVSSSRRVRITRGTQSLCIDMLAGPPRQFVPISAPDFSSWGRSDDPANDVSAAPLDPGAAAQYHGRFASTRASTSAEFIALLRVNVPCEGWFSSSTQSATATETAAVMPAAAPCTDTAPAATRSKGVWTVPIGNRTVTIAADGRVEVGASKTGASRKSGHRGEGRGGACRGPARR